MLLMETSLQNVFQFLTLLYLFVTTRAEVTQGFERSPAPSNANSLNTISQQLFDTLFSRESHAFSIFIFSSLPHNQQCSHISS